MRHLIIHPTPHPGRCGLQVPRQHKLGCSRQSVLSSMQSRGDSAAALDMLPALKGKEKGLCYAIDQQQQQQQAPSQLPQQHSHQSMSLCLSPADIYTHVAEGGEGKGRNSWLKEVVLGITAGAFISFGFSTCMIAAGQVSTAGC